MRQPRILKPVTMKVIAEVSSGPTIFRACSIVGQPDRYALHAQDGELKFNLVMDGKVLLQFADEIKKGVLN